MAKSNTKITDEHIKSICDRLVEGRSLRSICRDDDMPFSAAAVRQWIARNHESALAAQYYRSRDLGLDEMAEELLEVADDGTNDFTERLNRDGSSYVALDKEHVARSRLRCDTRKWYLSKLAPRRYGDRIQTDVTSSDGSLKQLSPEQINMRLEQILENAKKRKEAQEAQTKNPKDQDQAEQRRIREQLDELL